MKSARKSKNKKVARMSIDEVRQMLFTMKEAGHDHSKKYEHLQARLHTLKVEEHKVKV